MPPVEARQYTVNIQPAAEGGYWAEVPALPGCFAQAQTLEEVTATLRQLVEDHLAELMRRGETLPVEKPMQRTYSFPLIVRPRLR
ncbi:MAG: type II toxin-antitoxin system HicB family antitoxin [Verrucomicrobiales bacterium]|nr:type II toxin-antitoxin system HicB family antitoxin [Verrucomicrobiales bacterium]